VTERDQQLHERAALRAEFGGLFDAVSAALFEDDPVGINFESNTDEYDPEVGTILPRLEDCVSEDDVARVVREEFVRWFGADVGISDERYRKIAADIWLLWTRHNQS
jgi:hypothetical protein